MGPSGRITPLLLLFALLSPLLVSFVPSCSAKCFSFMGMNSCMSKLYDTDDELPFTPEWFFVNVYRRVPLIKIMKSHFFNIRLVEMTMNMYAPLREASMLMDSDEFWKLFGELISYLESVRGEPVDLLYDEKITPVDLLRTFRHHASAIVDFIEKADEDGAFSEEVHRRVEQTLRLLRDAGRALNNLPEFTQSPYFKVIEQSVYNDPKFSSLLSMAKPITSPEA